jgi:D-glycero-alpha-D-manno-heptose 1-phosphate guanylyltransferase
MSRPTRSTEAAWGIVLAGGAGTRLGGLFKHCAKPFVPVAGRPFLEYVFDQFGALGVDDVVVSLGHRADVGEYYLRRRRPIGPRLHVACEQSPLGTAGAILHALNRVPPEVRHIVAANGDSVVFGDLAAAREKMRRDRSLDGVLCAVEVDDAREFGTLEISDDGLLQAFCEKQNRGRGVINAGLYLFRRATLEWLRKLRPKSLEREAFPRLLAEGARFAVQVVDGPLLDIGTPARLATAEHYLLHRWDHRGAA